jgi:hypothetical protein
VQPIKNYVPVTKAKTILLDMVRKIKDSDDTMDRFEGLLETLEILSDERAMKSIRKSIQEADKGMWVDYNEVFPE